MLLDVDRYRHSSPKRKRRNIIPVVAVALLVLIPAVVVGVVRLARRDGGGSDVSTQQATILELWNIRDYDSIIARCEESLRRDPMNTDALVFKGFACFYKAVSEMSLEEKIPLYDEAIVALRRAKLGSVGQWSGEIDYVLGKAYFHKGRYYHDLSVRYLLSSLDEMFLGDDSYEYLGIAYTQLGDPAQGIDWFLKALDENRSDLLLLTIAQNYVQLEQPGEAEGYLLQAIDVTEEPAIEKKSRFLLGEIYYARKQYGQAEEHYSRILQIDPESADAHYYLGEVFLAAGDPIKARKKWRDAYISDPNHYGARLRLFN